MPSRSATLALGTVLASIHKYDAASVTNLRKLQEEWNYDDIEAWNELEGSVCGTGQRQSPIDLPAAGGFGGSLSGALPILGNPFPETEDTLEILNNGETVRVLYGDLDTYNLQGNWGLLHSIVDRSDAPVENFKLAQTHFHWGRSEHTVAGTAYDLEAHLVHWNTQYASITEAAAASDGLLVIGVFFQSSDSGSDPLAPVVAPFATSVMNVSATATITGFSLQDVVGSVGSGYTTYAGSLTTPLCSETVTWVLIDEVQSISPATLAAFTENVESLSERGNWRPIQEGNGRVVYSAASQGRAVVGSVNEELDTPEYGVVFAATAACFIVVMACLIFGWEKSTRKCIQD